MIDKQIEEALVRAQELASILEIYANPTHEKYADADASLMVFSEMWREQLGIISACLQAILERDYTGFHVSEKSGCVRGMEIKTRVKELLATQEDSKDE